MPGIDATTLPQPFYADQVKILRQLGSDHAGDPVALARGYSVLFSRPELEGTALRLSPDFDWQSETVLERVGLILERLIGDVSHTGGTPTPEGEHPEIVALQQLTLLEEEETTEQVRTVGSAVKVNSRVLLTASHVIRDHQPNRAFFRELPYQQDRLATLGSVVAESPADIAAVVLENPLAEIPSVPIAADGAYDLKSVFRSVGFGSMIKLENPTVAVKNHVASIAVMTLDCSEQESIEAYKCLPARELVAGTPDYTACVNDSGGALLVLDDFRWALVGIIRRGIVEGCETAVRYARVSAYRDELNQKLRDRFPGEGSLEF